MGIEENQKPGKVDRNLLVIFSITLMAVLGISSITPAFPKVVERFNIPPAYVGFLITFFTFPGIILAPFMGILADRFGRKKIITPSLFLFALTGTMCAFSNDYNMLLILRLFQGIGASALGSLNVTLIGDIYQGKRRTAAMGYNASVLSIGTASYPSIGGALALFGWNYPFLLPLLAIPVGLAVIFLLENPEPEKEGTIREYLKNVLKSLNDRKLVSLFFAGLITFIILFGSYLSYFPIFLSKSFKVSTLIIGLIMSCMSLTTAITSSQLGKISQRIEEKNIIKYAFIVYGIALFLIPLIKDIKLMLIPVIIFGVAHGVSIPSIQTLIAGLAPLDQRAAFMSVNGMILRTGQTIGPIIMGGIFDFIGLNWVFFAGFLFSIFTSFILILFMR
jgi:MFS family permease